MKPLVSEGSMTNRATAELRAAILRGDLEAGVLHAVHVVAERLGVSRTPVREALIRLSADGLVRIQRNRGFVVLRSSVQDLSEIFSLRILLEVPAARAAATIAGAEEIKTLRTDIERMRDIMAEGDAERFLQADRQFHKSLLLVAGNARLADYVDSLRNVVLTNGVSTANQTESIEEILAPHIEILNLVEQGDANGAAACMYRHLVNTGLKLIKQEFGDDAVARFEESLVRFRSAIDEPAHEISGRIR